MMSEESIPDPHQAPQEWGEPWRYRLNLMEPDDESRKGYWPLWASGLFAVAAVLAYGWAEYHWQSVVPRVSGNQLTIGIGESGLAATLYLRAVALAALSVACGVIAIVRRRAGSYRVDLWQEGQNWSRPADRQ